MIFLGISAIDQDSTVTLLDDDKIIYALAEERLSRIKMHAGFPYKSLELVLKKTGLKSDDIQAVGYPFLGWPDEAKCKIKNFIDDVFFQIINKQPQTFKKIKQIAAKCSQDKFKISGLLEEDYFMKKSSFKKFIYDFSASSGFSDKAFHVYFSLLGLYHSILSHRKYHQKLLEGLHQYGLEGKLTRVDHHLTHAANAFYTSGFKESLIVTLDGYGTGLSGSVSLGNAKGIKRIEEIPFPNSLGTFYEQVTSALGYRPGRHEGKIVGLAAYGNPDLLLDVLRSRFFEENGTYRMFSSNNSYFSRMLSGQIPKPHIAAAYQKVLEHVAVKFVTHQVEKFNIDKVVLSGGIFANVKLNQRIFEISGVKNIFVHPAMGDGGTGTGAALFLRSKREIKQCALNSVYLGCEYSNEEVESELKKEKLNFKKYDYIESEIAKLLQQNKVIARFNGRMEYGPRSLGNRSVLYQTTDPEVNHWLNKRLGRTEFMPFAPATLYDDRHKCYLNIDGAERTAEFMTITFDCTDWMKENCPAAVHIDGTARPQLVKKEINPSFHNIISEYKKLTGIPCLVNTSFNMHEEPIVCSPFDAIRAFKLGKLDYLAINDFLVSESDGCLP